MVGVPWPLVPAIIILMSGTGRWYQPKKNRDVFKSPSSGTSYWYETSDVIGRPRLFMVMHCLRRIASKVYRLCVKKIIASVGMKLYSSEVRHGLDG